MASSIKQKRCPVCREMYTPKRYGLRLTRCCDNAGCRLDYAQGVRAKEASKEAKRKKKEFYKKEVSWQLKQCQPVFNKLRRLQELKWFADRCLEPTCISCGKPKGDDIFCNGHFKSVGSSSSLRFDPVNSYLQHNKRCNSALSADINGTATTHGYKQGLINRFGEEEATMIMFHCEVSAAAVTRWEWQELESMRKNWNAEIRKLEKEMA